jgi:hypothetical protein
MENTGVWTQGLMLARHMCTYDHKRLIDWHWVLLTFCLVWPWSVNLLISTSSVASIIGISQCTWSKWGFLFSFWYCSLNTGPRTCQAGTLLLDSHSQFHFLFKWIVKKKNGWRDCLVRTTLSSNIIELEFNERVWNSQLLTIKDWHG